MIRRVRDKTRARGERKQKTCYHETGRVEKCGGKGEVKEQRNQTKRTNNSDEICVSCGLPAQMKNQGPSCYEHAD